MQNAELNRKKFPYSAFNILHSAFPLAEARQCFFPAREDAKQLVQLRNHKYFVNLRLDVRQAELAVALLEAVVGVNEHAEGSRAQVVDGRKIEQKLRIFLFVDEGFQRRADLGDIGFVENAVIRELNDADVLILLYGYGRGRLGHGVFLGVDRGRVQP